MKKIKLFYNPVSGDKKFPQQLDTFIYKFQNAGYEVAIYRSEFNGDITKAVKKIVPDEYSILAVAGGDGTINEMVNGMVEAGIDIPLAIFPVGTANDFANHLNLPKSVADCCDVVLRNNIKEIDIGRVNNKYFINVCSGGLFTSVSQSVDLNVKNTLGKLAYYIKGIEQLPNFRPFKLRIETSGDTIEDFFYLFLVLNGNGAGGFERLSRDASVQDGLFDFVGVKAKPFHELAILFLKILKGEHLDDPNILFIRDKKFKITCLEEDRRFYKSDVDGEKGPDLPLNIVVVEKKLKVFTNL